MDKVTHYNHIVHDFMKLQASYRLSRESIETQFVKDEHENATHYLLINIGFRDMFRVYGPFIHIDVKNDGKVWIQHDGTDLPVALRLIEMGIPKEDIVLGFHPEELRQYTDFAIA